MHIIESEEVDKTLTTLAPLTNLPRDDAYYSTSSRQIENEKNCSAPKHMSLPKKNKQVKEGLEQLKRELEKEGSISKRWKEGGGED